MLSGLLRNEIAIETNIKIMRAFVAMRRSKMTQGLVPFVNVQYALFMFNFRDFTFIICKNLRRISKN